MDLEEAEARSDCACEGQQQFNWPTDQGQLPFSRDELLLLEAGN
jgi:hypothetical protein